MNKKYQYKKSKKIIFINKYFNEKIMKNDIKKFF